MPVHVAGSVNDISIYRRRAFARNVETNSPYIFQVVVSLPTKACSYQILLVISKEHTKH